MFIYFILTPLIMLFCGFFMFKFSPKKTNGFVGYRTKRSKINSDTWLFANRYCGKLWIILGLAMIALSGALVGVSIITGTKINDKICLIVESFELAVLLFSIIPVEVKLKNKFNENGNRWKSQEKYSRDFH